MKFKLNPTLQLYLYLLLMLIIGSFVSSAQTTGYDKPIYTVTYEVIPAFKIDTLNTIIFNLPVTEDYFDSVSIKQEVTDWFRTIENVTLLGNIPDKWKLIIRNKQIITKNGSISQH